MTQIQFPLSIGLIGAPGTGKQQWGELFHEKASGYFAEHDSDLWIIDNAGRTIEQEFDQAMGVFGSPLDDLRAYHLRQEQELTARAKGVSFVSLGSAVDHIAHTGINVETVMTGLTTPDQDMKVQRGQLVMTVLTMLMQEQFRYNFGFYIPHSGTSVILPGEPDTENEYNQRIDRGIQMVFANFGMRIQVLDQPTLEEKVDAAFETIERIVENGPDLPPQEEAPEEEGHEADPEAVESIEDPVPSPEEDSVLTDA